MSDREHTMVAPRSGRLSRRALLALFGGSAVAGYLTACSPSAAPTQPPAPAPAKPAEPAPAKPAAPAPTQPAAKPAAAPSPAAKAPAPAAKLKEVSLRLNWLVSPNHTGFFLAQSRGYYKEVGLEVKIGEGRGTNSTIQLIAQNQDSFGFATADGVIKGVLQGAPLKAVATITQKGPQSIIARGNAGIRRVEDLPGKSLGGTPGGTAETILPAVLKKANVSPDSFKFVSGDARTKLALILQGQLDALVGFMNDEAITLQLEGVNPVVIPYSDYGINLLGETIVVNSDWLKQNAETTRQFLTASLRGWGDADKNPEEGVQALLQVNKELKPDYVRNGLKVQLGLMRSKSTEGKPLGWQAMQDWQQLQDLLKEFDIIKETRPVETYFTNEHLPAGS